MYTSHSHLISIRNIVLCSHNEVLILLWSRLASDQAAYLMVSRRRPWTFATLHKVQMRCQPVRGEFMNKSEREERG